MSRLGVAALVVLALVALLAIVGPLLWTIAGGDGPLNGLAAQGGQLLGTDELGSDVLRASYMGSRDLVSASPRDGRELIGVLVGAWRFRAGG